MDSPEAGNAPGAESGGFDDPAIPIRPMTPARPLRSATLAITVTALLSFAPMGCSARPDREAAAAAPAPAPASPPPSPSAAGPSADPRAYGEVAPSRDGIGKTYMGREIARIMSHRGAGWLERPEREREEQPDRMIEQLGLAPGMVVADVGAGIGYHAARMAARVGPTGTVWAVEVQPEMLAQLQARLKSLSVANVRTVLGTGLDPGLPAGAVDLVLMVDVYHELENPREMLDRIVAALKPGGRVAFVEYRAEDPAVPILPLHRMTEAQVRREAEASGLRWERTGSGLPWQHLVIFRKPG